MGQRPNIRYHRWEGVYAADFTLGAVRSRVAALAGQLSSSGWSCLVASDTRFMAGQFALDAFRLLEDSGVSALLCPAPAPLPAVERALDQRRADCALVVSAANRPHWFGGLVALTPPLAQPLFGGDLPAPDLVRPFPPAGEPPEQSQIDLRGLYLDALRTAVDAEFIRRTSQTIFVDPMTGTSSGYIPALLGDGSQTKAIEINRDADPLFQRQPPQPTEAGLARLRKLVRESDSHLGVAISADGRALAAVDNAGDLLAPADLALVIGQHLSRQYRQRGLVVVPPGGEELHGGARAWDEAYGLKLEQTESAAARIVEVAERDRAGLVVGVSAAGEVTLGRALGVPDALLAALVLIEAVARSGQKLRPLLASLRARG